MLRLNTGHYDFWRSRARGLSICLLLGAFLLSGCSISAPFAQSSATPASSALAPTPLEGTSATPVISPDDVPLFDPLAAIQAMQSWTSQVKSGKVSDGTVRRSPTNSGMIKDTAHPDDYVPYGVSNVYQADQHGMVKQVSIVGSILYVFAYQDSSDTSTFQYALLLGTLTNAGQPITLLVWITDATPIVASINVLPIADPLFGDEGGAEQVRFLNLAGLLNDISPRTVALRFITDYASQAGASVPADAAPQVIKRNSDITALVAIPPPHQAGNGVFATLPPPDFTVSPQDGAEVPATMRVSVTPPPQTIEF